MPRPRKHPLTESKEPSDPVEAGKAGESTDNPPQQPLGGMTIVGQQREGKNPTRLYQTAPDVKEWLTKEEAERIGRYWRD